MILPLPDQEYLNHVARELKRLREQLGVAREALNLIGSEEPPNFNLGNYGPTIEQRNFVANQLRNCNAIAEQALAKIKEMEENNG